jgi:serine/threonine-protein kinase
VEVSLALTETLNTITLQKTWRIGEQIASGGFGTVYMADSEDASPAVVKLIPKVPGAERELLFEELNGVPNVIPVIDRGEWDNYWVLVMKRAETSLRSYLDALQDRLNPTDAILILIDITKALVKIEGNIVHRDIKPENILFLDGYWCLADFGIARYAEATTTPDTAKYAKTPVYASPEQWRDERVCSASDVYSFGVVAYELLQGSPPFQGSVSDLRHQHLSILPEQIHDIPEELQSLVQQCLIKRPGARPSASNILARLMTVAPSSSSAELQLKQANVVAVICKAEAEKQRLLTQEREALRRDLFAEADNSLNAILDLLARTIATCAPSVQTKNQPPSEWILNKAKLRVEKCAKVQSKWIQHLPFDILGYSEIEVTMLDRRHGYSGRSHSLWYCDVEKPGKYRWYETAFGYSSDASYRSEIEPFSLGPYTNNIELPLKSIPHTLRIVWPFIAIDQGSENHFVDQWIEWFAQASQGELSRPLNAHENS